MRILQLSPQCPYPKSDGGKIGIASILEHLSKYKDVEITFAFYTPSPISELVRSELQSNCHRFIEIPHSTNNSIPRILNSILTNTSLYIEKHISPLAVSILTEVMIEEQIEIIHVDHSAMMPLALELQSKYPCKIGYRLHNIEWILWMRYADSCTNRDFKKGFLSKQAELLKTAEADFISKADVVFPISTVDLERAKELNSTARFEIVSAGTNTEYWKPRNPIEKSPTIVLATTYDWIPNRDGLNWFLKEVFPKIVTKVPNVSLQLLGKNAFNHYSSNSNITVLGYVEDARPYIQNATVTICPLFVGSGIRIKILESLCGGTSVVSTSVGAEGIHATESEGLYITDDAEQFSRYCIDLLLDPHKAYSEGVKAMKYIEHHWKWEWEIKKMYTAYTSLLNRYI